MGLTHHLILFTLFSKTIPLRYYSGCQYDTIEENVSFRSVNALYISIWSKCDSQLYFIELYIHVLGILSDFQNCIVPPSIVVKVFGQEIKICKF